jgi:hypothetical protein
MRRHDPDRFDLMALRMDAIGTIGAFGVFAKEYILADKAFSRSLNLTDRYPEQTRGQLIDALDREYRRYGLSTGKHQTRELVRGFEAAATAQIARREQGH